MAPVPISASISPSGKRSGWSKFSNCLHFPKTKPADPATGISPEKIFLARNTDESGPQGASPGKNQGAEPRLKRYVRESDKSHAP